MRTLTAPGYPAQDRPAQRRPARGRWIWGLSGLVTLTALAIPLALIIAQAGVPQMEPQPSAVSAPRTFTVRQPVTSLELDSAGANIVVTAGPVRDVQVTEVMTDSPQGGSAPVATPSVSRGLLTLGAPACEQSNCSVGFNVTVPRDVAVTASSEDGSITVSGVAAANLDSGGGPVLVSDISRQLAVSSEDGPITASGVADANLDSGGGNVRATDVRGPLTVDTEDGSLVLVGVTGPLDADTGGGNLLARDVSAVTATVSTEDGSVNMGFTTAPEMVSVDSGGGNARISFAAAPQSVTLNTEDGFALLTVPAGQYAVTAETDGGPPPVLVPGIVDNPTAHRSITVTSGGGSLQIQPR
jgi:Putative adhesin